MTWTQKGVRRREGAQGPGCGCVAVSSYSWARRHETGKSPRRPACAWAPRLKTQTPAVHCPALLGSDECSATHTCMCSHTNTRLHTQTCTHTRVRTYTHPIALTPHLHIGTLLCTHVYPSLTPSAYMRTHTPVHTHTQPSVHQCTHVHTHTVHAPIPVCTHTAVGKDQITPPIGRWVNTWSPVSGAFSPIAHSYWAIAHSYWAARHKSYLCGRTGSSSVSELPRRRGLGTGNLGLGFARKYRPCQWRRTVALPQSCTWK